MSTQREKPTACVDRRFVQKKKETVWCFCVNPAPPPHKPIWYGEAGWGPCGKTGFGGGFVKIYSGAVIQNFTLFVRRATQVSTARGLRQPMGVLSDHNIFCEILVQRPIDRPSFHLPSRMIKEDLKYMTVMAQKHFDRIMAVLKACPRQVLLLIRYVSATAN